MGAIKDAWDIIKERAEWQQVLAQAAKVPLLEKRIAALEAKLMGGARHVCGACGSSSITRTGSRRNPAFGEVGVQDALFLCNICDAETAIMIDP